MRTAILTLLALLATPTLAQDNPNWLVNSSFETAQDTRPLAWDLGMEGKGEGEAIWQEGTAHTGQRCLRVKLTTKGDYYMGRQRLSQPVQPGALYQLNGWYRSDTESVAHPVVYYVREDGIVMSAFEVALPLATQWTRFQYDFTPPDGTVRFEVQLRAQGLIGAAWYDDVFVGPAAKLQAQRRADERALRTSIRRGPLTVRVLPPSERPQLLDLVPRLAELRKSTSASIFAARNERESFGAIVLGLGNKPLTARLTDLKGPGGARLPATQAKIRWADWVEVAGAWLPDPLLEKQPFTASPNGFPMLWVTIHVPDQARPGTYSAELTVQSGAETARVPVRLQVHDFTLPVTTRLQSSFWMFRHCLRNAYGMQEIPFDFYQKWLDLCLETRLAPIDAAEWHDQPLVQMVRDEQGQLQVNWEPWDQYLQYSMDRGMSAFNVADDHWFGNYFQSFQVRDLKTGQTETVKLDPQSQEYADTVIRFFRLALEHFTERGWANKGYLQAYDEPGQDQELLAAINRFHNLARTGWPGLRTLITTPIDFGGLSDDLGIWCPLTPHYDDKLAAEARARGQEVWWYVCCGPTAPWANFFLKQPGAAHRVLFWQTYGRKSDGLLYWGVNHWPDFCARTMDPLSPDKKWPQAPWNDGGRNGDGYFLYPGPDGPLTGLRFEIMRDGVEDYDALRMLEGALKEQGQRAPITLRARAENALTMTPDIYATMTAYPLDAKAMVDRRREVNQLIVELGKIR